MTTPDVGQWLMDWTGDFGFLRQMQREYRERGSLTARQWAAVERCRAHDEQRAALAAVAAAGATPAPLPVVAELQPGRHAVLFGHEVRFYVVRTPDEGRYKDWTFVSIQGGDVHRTAGFRRPNGEFVVKLPEVMVAVEQIAADPMATLARYGHEIGACGVCGRALTDETSRRVGIGPVCLGRLRSSYGEAA